jgi:hypothetical protein
MGLFHLQFTEVAIYICSLVNLLQLVLVWLLVQAVLAGNAKLS